MEYTINIEVKEVIVIVGVKMYDKIGGKKIANKEVDFPAKFFFKVPVYMDFENYLTEYEDSVNTIIAKNLEALTGVIKAKADKQKVDRPDGVEYTITRIFTKKKEKPKGMAEWKTI